ncbi:RHS/YD repeat-containing protein [Nitrospirillum viridazoti Y2]|uniref:YD repeat-containing protein n=1 Tax=Nitrospirillum amazonense TaxID=28077 RepID=A0A560HRF5_9PROT|nr:RHS/YD repeat-containing protein [Nitrospirillum amazonense Y2]TWB48965.1 YD repeat-containing protein [Nitrospirillum amazonense]
MAPVPCGRRRWAKVVFAVLSTIIVAGQSAYADTQYVYDALGRLTKVTYGNGAVTTYTYDAAGNRTTVTTNNPAASSASIAVTPLPGGKWMVWFSSRG